MGLSYVLGTVTGFYAYQVHSGAETNWSMRVLIDKYKKLANKPSEEKKKKTETRLIWGGEWDEEGKGLPVGGIHVENLEVVWDLSVLPTDLKSARLWVDMEINHQQQPLSC